MPEITRRNLMLGSAGVASVLALGGLAACSQSGSAVGPTSEAVRRAEESRRRSGQKLVTARLTPRPLTVNLGGQVVQTWGYGDSLPGPVLRARAGDLLRVKVDNQLPADTSIHWHGVALRNNMDGVPGITQQPIKAGGGFQYEFTVPDPGTYFYHPHSGVQLDRGLYGVLVVDDPADPGNYDEEWIVVLDDWVDGTGRTPDEVLRQLRATAHGSPQRSDGWAVWAAWTTALWAVWAWGRCMERCSRQCSAAPATSNTRTTLINGRTPGAPVTLSAKPGRGALIRIINAGSDTAFRVALGGHRMTVTHSDGFPVSPLPTDALLIGMGERYDVLVTLRDGAFPLVASAEGKNGQGLAVLRTGSGRTPARNVHPAELNRRILLGTDVVALEQARLSERRIDRQHALLLSGSMAPYRWTINGKTFPDADPLPVDQGGKGTAQLPQHVDDVPSDPRPRPHLRLERRWCPEGHRHRSSHAVRGSRPGRRQPGPVGDSLPQHLPR